MISFISLLEIVNAVISDPNIFFWIPASVAAGAVNPNVVNPIGLSKFSLKINQFLLMILKVYVKVLPFVVLLSDQHVGFAANLNLLQLIFNFL